MVIAVSTALTWACTPRPGKGPGGAFTSAESARRTPAPDVNDVLAAELALTRASRRHGLLAYVVCPGIVYGRGERELGPMLRSAYEGKPLSVYGDGSNRLPVVHADDLADSLVHLISTRPTGAPLGETELLTGMGKASQPQRFLPISFLFGSHVDAFHTPDAQRRTTSSRRRKRCLRWSS